MTKCSGPDHLLEILREILRDLLPGDLSQEKRIHWIGKLTETIDEIDSLKYDGKLRFTVTYRTAQAIESVVTSLPRAPIQEKLAANLKRGCRETKQRVYFVMDAEYDQMKLLRDSLSNFKRFDPSRRALDRICDQIDKEVLSKSPLQHLAETGY